MPRDEKVDDGEVAPEPRFLTLDDVSRYLNVSVPQVYALVRSGELPAIKIGGRGIWRVDREKLDAYIEGLHQKTEESATSHPLDPRTQRHKESKL